MSGTLNEHWVSFCRKKHMKERDIVQPDGFWYVSNVIITTYHATDLALDFPTNVKPQYRIIEKL